MVLPVFQHAYLKCPMLYVNICYIWMGIIQKHKDYLWQSVLQQKKKLKQGVIVIVLGNVRGEITLWLVSYISALGLSCKDYCVTNFLWVKAVYMFFKRHIDSVCICICAFYAFLCINMCIHTNIRICVLTQLLIGIQTLI